MEILKTPFLVWKNTLRQKVCGYTLGMWTGKEECQFCTRHVLSEETESRKPFTFYPIDVNTEASSMNCVPVSIQKLLIFFCFSSYWWLQYMLTCSHQCIRLCMPWNLMAGGICKCCQKESDLRRYCYVVGVFTCMSAGLPEDLPALPFRI